MEVKTALGGTEKVQTVGRQTITPTKGFGDGGAGDLARNLNSVINQAGKFTARQQVIRDAEDNMDMKTHAIDESIDINNALVGASYDGNLNASVIDWRAEGVTDTEIRVRAKAYKINQALIGFDAENVEDAGENASTFFETFNSLELRAVTPLAEKDYANRRNGVKNKMSASFSVGVEDMQTRYKQIVSQGTSNGFTREEIDSVVINSAYAKYRRTGDASDIEALEELKGAKGIRVIDTLAGSKMYNQVLDMKEVRDINDEARAIKAEVARKAEVTSVIYSSVINSESIETAKITMDSALDNGDITLQQHDTLRRTYENLLESGEEEFRKQSIPRSFSEMLADAQLGVLTQEELIARQSELSWADYSKIATLAIQKGDYTGLDNEQNDIMNKAIVDFGKDFAGIDLTATIVSDLEGLKLGQKRQSSLEENLRKKKYAFIRANDRLPDEEEFNDMKKDTIQFVDDTVGTLSVTGDVATEGKSPARTFKYEEYLKGKPTLKSDIGKWYKTLPTEHQKTYRASLIKQRETNTTAIPKVQTPTKNIVTEVENSIKPIVTEIEDLVNPIISEIQRESEYVGSLVEEKDFGKFSDSKEGKYLDENNNIWYYTEEGNLVSVSRGL